MAKTVARAGREMNLVDALNAEWAELVTDTPGTVEVWGGRHPAVSGCSGLADVLNLVRADPDKVLAALLVECSLGDQLAGRVVLQAMLGKIVRMAARDAQSGVDDYVSLMWVRIRTYPLAARPERIAANLALDTLKAVLQERRWLRSGEVTPYPPDAFVRQAFAEAMARDSSGPGYAAEPDARGVINAAQRLGLINGEASAVLTSVYADGLSGAAAGELYRTSPGAIRYRCSTSVRRLAQHAHLLVSAA
jgi:hypothetical protein